MKIKGMYMIVNSDVEDFYRDLIEKVNILQEDKQEVEIQYQINNNEFFSALVIGRQQHDKEDI
ncbi:hypothetical protein G6Z25_02380 [Clostridium perfringens]|uniref:hypothetical protein n=1 Tax=Clostridium perfringens TaxID=1502 RepID=UPI0013E3616E|nr:hypothetical protein [Clostridium perfringens]NGS95767.1 hypothetical protein [Clostridium perfringens]